MKEFQHNLRLAADDLAALVEVAAAHGLDKSELLRFLVHKERRELRAQAGQQARPVSKKRRARAA
jgi:hypothetical protein